MVEFDEIKEPLRKILETFHKKRKLLVYYPKTSMGDIHITIQNIIDLSCNHLFDDCPNLFNIKKIEAHKIRAYIQNNIGGKEDRFTSEMKNNFSNLLEE